jgi:hypothetical protein
LIDKGKMAPGLRILVVDPDDDYLGVELRAASARYAGSTRIYAGLEELSQLASQIEGFPRDAADDRRYEFGSTDPRIAGGFARLRFYCVDGAGHAAIEVTIEDDDQWHTRASATFSFRIEPLELDRFLKRLRDVQGKRRGEAVLAASV